jgi:hypothetical protein
MSTNASLDDKSSHPPARGNVEAIIGRELDPSQLSMPAHSMGMFVRGEHPCQTARRIILSELYPVLPTWQQQFSERYGWDVQLELEGSLKIGSLVGPKSSLNPELNGEKVIDVDISLRLPDHLDPTDEGVIEAISDVTGSKLWQNFAWDYWGLEITAGVYFQYKDMPILQDLVGTSTLELEMVVRCANATVAFADYWNQIFTPPEIEQQIREKKAASKLGKEAYLAVKAQHDVDARYRIMFGWHTGALEGMPEVFRPLLSNWFTWGWKGTDGVWEGVTGVMPRPPGDKSYAWLSRAWEQAERLNALKDEAEKRVTR